MGSITKSMESIRMTLLPEVKNYFEEHISALDRDDWFEFIINAYQDLKSEEFNQLLEVLKAIEPKFEDKVEPSLMYVITRAFEQFDEDVFQGDYISIDTFLNSYLRSFFTFDITYLKNYIIANANEWSENIWNKHGLWGCKKDG